MTDVKKGQYLVIFSRHLFALKRAVLFSSRCDKTLPCFLEAPEFVFEASYDGWGHFSFHSELVCAGNHMGY